MQTKSQTTRMTVATATTLPCGFAASFMCLALGLVMSASPDLRVTEAKCLQDNFDDDNTTDTGNETAYTRRLFLRDAHRTKDEVEELHAHGAQKVGGSGSDQELSSAWPQPVHSIATETAEPAIPASAILPSAEPHQSQKDISLLSSQRG